MKKARIVKFVKEKHPGVYDAIVDEYSLIIIGWSVRLIKSVIQIDLERHTGERVKLNYLNLAKAVKKFKAKKIDIKK